MRQNMRANGATESAMERVSERASEPSTVWDDRGPLTALGGPGSEVFRARTREGDRAVALRLWCGTSRAEIRAASERVSLASRVSHAMMASVEGCEERGNGALWIASEYVPGPTLEAWSSAGRRLPLPAAIDLVRRLSLGVQAALRVGVSHHAIQPRNLVIWRQNPQRGLSLDGKLLDLGVAAWMQSELPQLESAHFMAPESLASVLDDRDPSDAIDARANVYSLGSLLYYLTTGALPFQSDSLSQLTAAHATRELVEPREHNPAISDALQCVLVGALAVQSSARYANPGELANVLASVELRSRSGGMLREVPQPNLPNAREPRGATEHAEQAEASDASHVESLASASRMFRDPTATQEINLAEVALTWSTVSDERLSVPPAPSFVQPPGRSYRAWLPALALIVGVAAYFSIDYLALPKPSGAAKQAAPTGATAPDEITADFALGSESSARAKALQPSAATHGEASAATDAKPNAAEHANTLAATAGTHEATAAAAPVATSSHHDAPHASLTEPAPLAEHRKVEPAPSTAIATTSGTGSGGSAAAAPALAANSGVVNAANPAGPGFAELPREVRIKQLVVRGSLIPTSVRRALERIRPRLTECYEHFTQSTSQKHLGPAHLELVIDEAGRSRDAQVKSLLPGLDTCIANVASKLVSQAPDTGTVDVSCDLRYLP
jgi:serine/threonine protein kinase